MTLLDVCEPLFDYVCLLNRTAKVGESLEVHLVRSELGAIFDRMRSTASAAGADLSVQFEKIEMPLTFFIDSMIIGGRSNIASQWLPIAEEKYGIATGDRDFWDQLEETLRDRTDAGTQRLLVFYTCVGLGFVGDKMGQPQSVSLKMKEVYARVRPLVDAEQSTKLCPEAYQVNTVKLPLNLRDRLIGILLAVLVMAVMVFVINAFLFNRAVSDLESALGLINDAAMPVPSAGAAPPVVAPAAPPAPSKPASPAAAAAPASETPAAPVKP